MSAEPAALSTPDLQHLLAGKYPRDRYALFFDVPDNVGTNAQRRADAIAVGCWKSVGHMIEGFELKVSRSDWLREVKSVSKADPFIERCDRWWLVTSTDQIAKAEEIPECWGWMAVTKGGLRIQRPAPRLPQPDTDRVHRLFMVGILRKLQEDMMKSPEVSQRMEALRQVRDDEIKQRVEQRTRFHGEQLAKLKAKVDKFEAESGLKLDDWRLGNVAALAKAIDDLSQLGGKNWDKVSQALAQQEHVLGELIQSVRLAQTEIALRK